MKAFIFVSIAALLLGANGLSVKETIAKALAGFEKSGLELSHDEGHCQCSKWGCWCLAMDDDVKIHAYFSVDETRQHRCSHTVIYASFFIGKASFTKEFPVDRFEDFCETVEGKRFCFRVDVEDNKHSQLLKGCLRVSRPHKVDMGCFKIPLMTSEPADMTSQELELAENINDDSEEIYIDNEEQLPENSFDRTVVEIEAPMQMDNIVGTGHCMCCEHGCSCVAVDDGYKVVVILSVDESRHTYDKHTIIQGNFRVGKETFVKLFDADELESFCQVENGKQFCFRISAKKVCSGAIHTCMSLTKPKRVNLGCFNIPL